MGIIQILFLLILLFSLGIPIAYSLMITSLCYLIVSGNIPLSVITQRMMAAPNSFTLLAVPFFVFAGLLMNNAGITKRIFSFAACLVGHIPGGLGHVNILSSVIFSGMSGSASADAGGLGIVEIQAMREAGGFDDEFIIGITAASSIIGPIIPPSVPAVIYGAMAGVSVGGLFIGGIIPGLLMAFFLSIMVYAISTKRNYPRSKRSSLKEIWTSFIKAFPSLLTPLIIIGGIWSGVFTPTEAASVAVLYSIILGFAYKEITIKGIWELALKSSEMAAQGMIIVSGAIAFGYVITREQIALKLANSIFSFTDNPYSIMFLIIFFLLFIGTFMDPLAAMIILIPIFNPIIRDAGFHPIHFGIIMIITLMIGLLTPPVGGVLYTLSVVSGVPFETVSKSVVIFLIPLIAVLIVLVFFPDFVLFLPRLLLGLD